MDGSVTLSLLLIVAALVTMWVVFLIANIVWVLPLWRAGYRPWRFPDATRHRFGPEPHGRIDGEVIVGWPSRSPQVGEILVEASGLRFLAGGRQVWVDRGRVSQVRVVRWNLRTWFIVDAVDGEYLGVFLAPHDIAIAIATFQRFGWPVTDRRGRARARPPGHPSAPSRPATDDTDRRSS